MKLTIIVPVYNSSHYLPNLLSELKLLKDVQIIFINDGSTDNSLELLNNFHTQALRPELVTVISQENKGPAEARNKGLTLANGEYILFVDSDDNIYPNEICSLLNSNLNSDIIIFGNDINIDKDIVVTKEMRNSIIDSLITSSDVYMLEEKVKISPVPWNKFYRSSLIKDCNLFFPENVKIGEDMLFNIAVFNEVSTVKFCSNKIYQYNNNPNSLTQSYNLNLAENLKFFLSNMKRYLTIEDQKKYFPKMIITDVIRGIKTTKDRNQLNHMADLLVENQLVSRNLNNKNKILFLLIKYRCWSAIKILIKLKK